MKKIVMGLVAALFAMNAMANRILWKVDIIGGEYSGWTGWVDNRNMSFVNYFENHTISDKAISDGIDIVARSSSGVILPWLGYDGKYGPWLEKEQGDGYEYVASSVQVILDDLPQGDSVQFLAGYFDWDNLDDSLPIDMDHFTAFAVSEFSSDTFKGLYKPLDIDPPEFSHAFSWNAVPEPSTAIFALFGTCLLFKRRKTTRA